MKRFLPLLMGLGLGFLAARPGLAQPANDAFGNAVVITGTAYSFTGTNANADTQRQTGEATFAGVNVRGTLWWRWTAPTNGLTHLDTFGSVYNTVLGVFTGTAVSALTEVASNNDAYSGTNASELTFTAVQGTTYQLCLGHVRLATPTSGNYTLHLQMRPTITLTSPTNNATYGGPLDLPLAAQITSPNGPAHVDFYHGHAGTIVATASNSPWTGTWTNAEIGATTLEAVVTDSASLSATSAVNVTIVPAGVAITSPTNSAWQYGTMPVRVETTNAYPRGLATVSNVELFANYVKIGESTNSPYGATWTNVSVGTSFFYAIMRDSAGLSYTSAPSYFYVLGQTMMPTGAVWKYLDDGTDQGTAWSAPAFDDSAWASGPAQLGYGDGDEATVVGYGPDANNKYITTYFRKAFVLTTAVMYTNWIARVLRDDGAVLYVNSTEAARFNMPTGAVSFTNLANNAADDGTIFFAATLNRNLFVEGTNVLAVEVHQSAVTSTDLSFEMELVAQKDTNYNFPPTVTLTSPTNGAALIGPANVTLTVNAADSDGSVTNVDYYSSTNKLGSARTSPFTFVCPNVAVGSYTLRAVATDNRGAKATSAPVAITLWATPQSHWVAFNEQNTGTASAPYTTPYTIPPLGTSAGTLLEISYGTPLPVILTVTNAPGYDVATSMGAPLAGTPAYNVFNGYVDWSTGSGANGIHTYATNLVGYTFSGLDPNRAYKFTATSVRAGAPGGGGSGNYYSNRWTQAEIVGAASWVPAHSSGVITSNNYPASLTNSQAAFNTGVNTNGEVVEWQNILPGPGGTFTVLCKQYRGAFPGGSGANAAYTFAFTALRLEEFGTAPLVTLSAPTNGAVFESPADVPIMVTSSGFGGVTNVLVATNNGLFANLPADAASLVWSNAPVGTNTVQAAAIDSLGGWALSPIVTFTVNAFVSNTPPILASVNPPAGASVDHLLAVQVIFNDPVSGVDAGDLLANGVAATGLSGSGSNYTFTFATPEPGPVSFTWAVGHGIVDLGVPPLPFDGTATNAVWGYTVLTNTVAPVVFAQNPPAGAIVSNTLVSIQVTFSEPVGGVDAADLIVNGLPATGLSGGGSNFTFSFSPVAFGGVVVAWATNHGITDLGVPSLAFDATAPNATWTYTLPSNSVPPVVATQTPLAGATLTNTLTSIQVIFSETVTGLNAGDLLINGAPATNLSGSGVSYTFRFPSPPLGTVLVTWATNHGIADIGTPPLPFDANGVGATWSYNLIDNVPPTIVSKIPAAGATLTNLTSIQITFSEAVTGVNANDLLINGTPASDMAGAGASYAFYFPQPATGAVSVTWAASHGITDLVGNGFNASGAGATWAYTVVAQQVMLVASNAWYYWRPGTSEASAPIDAWRTNGFNLSGWTYAQAPFYYDDDGTPVPFTGNTLITGMRSNYTSVFLRNQFVVTSKAAFTNLLLRSRADDGYIAWLNGVELRRYDVGSGALAYTASATAATAEPLTNSYYAVPNPAPLVDGTNVFAVQMFNAGNTSSDLLQDMDLTAQFVDLSAQAPRVFTVSPPVGAVLGLSNVTVTFTKAVTNVDAADFLVNGVPATNVTGSGASYTFRFAPPAFGLVAITWAAGHGIVDFGTPPSLFLATAPGNTWQYTSFNPSAPVVVTQNPLAGGTLGSLAQITVTFSKLVTNVDAADLLINGIPATGMTSSGADYTFTFPQPAYGNVSVSWAAGHGIMDQDTPANDFEAGRAGNTWSYTLSDQTPPRIVAQLPAAGATVTNFTQIQVLFTEAVSGVNASDLLINGVPATGLSGSGSNYTFVFAQPNASVIAISWAVAHGITDLATTPNAFDAYAAGSTWSYTALDNIAPTIASVYPPAGATVRALTQVQVTFTEPVTGVDVSDLRMNSTLAQSVSGSAAGPYNFIFAQPVTGAVEVAWTMNPGITDLASPPNPFAGGEWTYFFDPNAQFDTQIVINEIMFHATSESTNDGWIELHNTGTTPVNLTAWQFSKGVNFTFPNVTMPGDGYVVVAADLAAFQANYPGVTNVLGPWTGSLKKSGETIHLRNAVGELVDSVTYATGGDWGTRLRGSGEDRVLTMTRVGTTVTVVCPGNHQSGDIVTISGATQPEYNGTFAISGSSFSGFTYAISGTPTTPATGTILRRQLTDYTRTGWAWSCRADGLGSSMELVNPAMPHSYGQNWGASTNLNGTPGRANTVAVTNSAPLILEARHFPPVPTSTSPITFTARVLDENTNSPLTVRLYWRIDSASPPAFSVTNLYDDGGHIDGAASDGYYGFVLPAQANNTVIEFYFEARDAEGNVRTWPAPAIDTNGVPIQAANALLQVDNSTYSGNQPIYRLIMRETDRAELASYPPNGTYRASNAGMNGSFVGSDGTGLEFRYRSEFRNRGAGTRAASPMNYKITLPSDQPYHGVDNLNINSQYPHSQLLGYALAMKAGINTEQGRAVQIRVNAANLATTGLPSYGSYMQLEATDGTYAANHFPLDSAGNAYRCQSGGHAASLSSLGLNWTSYANVGYTKQSNVSDNDWTDLINLIYVLNTNTASDTVYAQAVRQVVNVEEWMRDIATFQLALSRETSLPATGAGDDYSFYRGVNDKRFILLAHDWDTILNQGDTTDGTALYYTNTIWRLVPAIVGTNANPGPNVLPLSRFMMHPDFAPIYYRELKALAETAFAPAEVARTVDENLGDWVQKSVLDNIKNFSSNRTAAVLAQIPLSITVGNSGLAVSNNFLRSTTPAVTLFGNANAIDTRSIKVNGQAASWTAWSARWTNTLTLQPGVNNVLVQSFGTNNQEVARANVLLWYDNGTGVAVSGALSGSTFWTPVSGPYHVTANVTVGNGATLTIQPGTTVFFDAGTTLTVSGSGRLLAEGTDTAHIHLTRTPGGANWGSLDFIGATNESRLAFADIDSCAGTTIGGHAAEIHVNGGSKVFFDHLSFANTPAQEYISFDASSFIVQNSVFPTYPYATSAPEMLHGVNGIPAGGYGIFRDNYFGHTFGFNDTIDFTGGNRPSAILQIIGNVFDGACDDHLDLDSTDAWIEGNIFLHAHRDTNSTAAVLDTSSAISGGVDFANVYSEWTIINNLFYDVDHACLNKGGGRFIFANNTLVHVNKGNGAGLDTDIGAFDFTDDNVALPDATVGAGAYVAGNIIWDCGRLVANYNPTNHTVIFEKNLLPLAWDGPGTNNVVTDPLLNLSLITNALTADWKTVKAALTPRSGSPVLGTGIGGFDKGGLNPKGLLLFGEPSDTTASTRATLTVAPGGTFNWGSVVPPYLWGYTDYRWKLDNGTWSAETPITTSPTITLSNLANGPHTVYVTGKNDAGWYQDDTFVYPTNATVSAHVTASRTWTVNASRPGVRLNELLAANKGAVVHFDTTPDVVELFNTASTPLDLGGIRLTDDSLNPDKFGFEAGTVIPAGGYLVVYADNAATPGLHLGFGLSKIGGALSLYDSPARGGLLLDSVTYGLQVENLSIGRLPNGNWTLNQPTFGAANVAVATGDPLRLMLNEWLAAEAGAYASDFIELFNPETRPVALGGLYLTDNPLGWPAQDQVAALSFIPANGYTVFKADGNPASGADHLNFSLASERGEIGLLASDLTLIDHLVYGQQLLDMSQGRSPNGGSQFAFLTPTPGSGNPGSSGGTTNIVSTTVSLLTWASAWRYNQAGTDLGTAWLATNYNDAAWSSGQGLFYGTNPPASFAIPINTLLSFTSPEQSAFYFRTHFTVATNTAGFSLVASHYIDDGAVFYLNGQELYRYNMPAGTISYATLATAGISGNATLLGPFSLPMTNLLQGDNVLAVEVHQSSLSSSDITLALTLDLSKSVTNVAGAAIVLNEIMANNLAITNADGMITDWVELYNPGSAAADLADCSLTDDPSIPRRWVFPAGAAIPPTSYLVLRCDSGALPSTNNGPILNTGFGLKSTGGGVYLYNSLATGGALAVSVVYGLQAENYTLGRVPNGAGAWQLTLPTPGSVNLAAALGNVSALKINEWLAAPGGNADDWFEVWNPNIQPVAVGGLHVTDDLNNRTKYTIPALSFIGALTNGYQVFRADKNITAGADHVNFKLPAAGGAIGLATADGTLIDGITYTAQDTAVSEGRFPDGSATIVRFPDTASPGESNYRVLTNVVVNEVLAHSLLPLEDAIELRNLTAAPVDIGGWWLSDAAKTLRKYRIPDGTTLAANGYAVFYAYEFDSDPIHNPLAFGLSASKGDEVYLSTGDAAGNLTGWRNSMKFGASEGGVSLGRYVSSDGNDHFVALTARTFGQDDPGSVEQFRTGTGLPNAAPKVGPIVVTEIMYHPPDMGTNDNSRDEFIELHNASSAPVPLYDPNFPANTWRFRDAVDFNFPPGVMLPAGSYALVVSFDPAADPVSLAAFNATYNLGPSVALYGPYVGKLANSTAKVELYKPDAPLPVGDPDAGFVPYVLVERVRYSDTAPWPTAADGFGFSLQRISATGFGNDPTNWLAAVPTPAPVTVADTDGDGMSDAWELAHGLNPNDPSDANLDPDHDGLTNLQEYQAGTDPTNAASVLKLEATAPVSEGGTNVVLTFQGVAGKSYTIQYSDLLPLGWTELLSLNPLPSSGPIWVTNQPPSGATQRFYRIVTPRQ